MFLFRFSDSGPNDIAAQTENHREWVRYILVGVRLSRSPSAPCTGPLVDNEWYTEMVAHLGLFKLET